MQIPPEETLPWGCQELLPQYKVIQAEGKIQQRGGGVWIHQCHLNKRIQPGTDNF